jgi:hypothetical protein
MLCTGGGFILSSESMSFLSSEGQAKWFLRLALARFPFPIPFPGEGSPPRSRRLTMLPSRTCYAEVTTPITNKCAHCNMSEKHLDSESLPVPHTTATIVGYPVVTSSRLRRTVFTFGGLPHPYFTLLFFFRLKEETWSAPPAHLTPGKASAGVIWMTVVAY